MTEGKCGTDGGWRGRGWHVARGGEETGARVPRGSIALGFGGPRVCLPAAHGSPRSKHPAPTPGSSDLLGPPQRWHLPPGSTKSPADEQGQRRARRGQQKWLDEHPSSFVPRPGSPRLQGSCRASFSMPRVTAVDRGVFGDSAAAALPCRVSCCPGKLGRLEPAEVGVGAARGLKRGAPRVPPFAPMSCGPESLRAGRRRWAATSQSSKRTVQVEIHARPVLGEAGPPGTSRPAPRPALWVPGLGLEEQTGKGLSRWPTRA